MEKEELGKTEFELVDKALGVLYHSYRLIGGLNVLAEEVNTLREKFRRAHTAWVEYE